MTKPSYSEEHPDSPVLPDFMFVADVPCAGCGSRMTREEIASESIYCEECCEPTDWLYETGEMPVEQDD